MKYLVVLAALLSFGCSTTPSEYKVCGVTGTNSGNVWDCSHNYTVFTEEQLATVAEEELVVCVRAGNSDWSCSNGRSLGRYWDSTGGNGSPGRQLAEVISRHRTNKMHAENRARRGKMLGTCEKIVKLHEKSMVDPDKYICVADWGKNSKDANESCMCYFEVKSEDPKRINQDYYVMCGKDFGFRANADPPCGIRVY